MQKTILYLALLILVGGGVYFLMFNKQDSLFGEKEAAFTVKNTDDVSRIFLAKTNGQSILLQKTDSGWYVNGRHRALQGMVDMLLQTLRNQEAGYPVPENSHNSVVSELSANSVKVEVYGKEGEKITTFFVGGEARNYEGTHMLAEGAKRPYVVVIPGFGGFLNTRYSTNIEDWRDRAVFAMNPAEITSISVEYPDEPLNSFTVTQQNGKVAVVTKEDVAGSSPMNEKRVKSFIAFFKNLSSEGYLVGVKGIDSVIKSVPRAATIEAVTNTGQKQHVDIYFMPLSRRSKNQLTPDEKTGYSYDADRYYAVMNNYRDTAIIQRFVFDKVFRKAYEFYQADKEESTVEMNKN